MLTARPRTVPDTGPVRLLPRLHTVGAVLATALGVAAAALVPWPTGSPQVPPFDPSERRPGGGTSRGLGATVSFLRPAANLGVLERPDFYAGRALARQPWVQAPTTTDARDGLGPLYNARTCVACHVQGGRGRVAQEDGPLAIATLVRLSVPARDGGAAPEPTYGTQLQTRSVALADQLRHLGHAEAHLAPEGRAEVRWQARPFRYPDGRRVDLRRPEVRLAGLAYGPLHPATQLGLRHAPPLHGLGLLELVDVAEVEALADPHDRDGDGISGRVNRVWDPVLGSLRPGRFGLKANQPSLRVQVAAALHGDLGVTSTVFPERPCTAAQSACRAAPHGTAHDGPEIADPLLTLLTGFTRSLAVPERRQPTHPLVARGRALFYEAGCASCHAPTFVTADAPDRPHLSRQRIWPYTDLLVHDMGPNLADGRPDGDATGAEWRTPPLWGVGLSRALHREAGLLHDGRARTVEEAVLWHGGEGRPSRERFTSLPFADRRALLAFVRSL